MRVLVTFGSKRGGTAGIARGLRDALKNHGLDVVLCPAADAPPPDGLDAVIIGGALYTNRWHRDARRYVWHHQAALRRVPTWFFSSGPLDDSAERAIIPPTSQVAALMEAVGAIGHVTFGGRLAQDAHGFPASAMAKKHAGDWRTLDPIRRFAKEIAQALPTARPGVVAPQPGRSLARLVVHGLVGWLLCAATLAVLILVASVGTALLLRAIVAPIVFTFVARSYFGAKAAREPLPTAFTFAGIVAALDLGVLAGLVQHQLALFGSVAGTWLPLVLIFLATWATGIAKSAMPLPKQTQLPGARA